MNFNGLLLPFPSLFVVVLSYLFLCIDVVFRVRAPLHALARCSVCVWGEEIGLKEGSE